MVGIIASEYACLRLWSKGMTLEDIMTCYCAWRAARLQAKVLRRVCRRRASGTKIRVVFYVADTAKWKCQSLYKKLEGSSEFEPLVIIGLYPFERKYKSAAKIERILCEKEEFFRKIGCRTERAVAGRGYAPIPLRRFAPDVLFLQQPWGVPRGYRPANCSGIALPFYMSYYVQVGYPPAFVRALFDSCLHTYFMLSQQLADRFEADKWPRQSHCRFVATGHTALDAFAAAMKETMKEGCVIYAPHFSFPHPDHLLGIGTFMWNGRAILEYAQQHRDMNWVFKPHPSLRRDLVQFGGWAQADVDAYYAAWEQLGEACYDGDYQELFLRSYAMITDCSSFLAEYGATGRPVIRLISSGCAYDRRELMDYVKTYYGAHTLEEMYAAFRLVLEERQDPLREVRHQAVVEAGLAGGCAADKVIAYMRDLFSIG